MRVSSGPGWLVVQAVSLSVGLLSVVAPVEAARQPPMSLDVLLERSGRVIEARVVGHDIAAGEGGIPKTRVTLHVVHALGDDGGPETFDVWLPEGLEAGSTIWSGFVGVPSFAPGETYLLFLRRAAWRVSPVVNWSYGHLRRVVVGGREVFVDMQGACAVGVSADGIARGPRVVDPPSVPGRGGGISTAPPVPSAVGACMAAGELRVRLAARLAALGWSPTDPPLAPRSWARSIPIMEAP